MKKLFTPQFLLLMITAIILSSCGSSTSITKRRYNKGYYISHSPNKNTTKTTAKTTAKTNTKAIKADEPLKVRDFSTEQTISTTQHEKNPITANTNKNNVKAKQATKKDASSTNLVPFNKSTPAELSIKNPFKAINKAVDQKLTASSGDGLSLFWIVILVLLILFLLGVIDGSLGGLIYILLVIALILLILWLLRIL